MPDAGKFGADSFRYRASDGTLDSLPATVSITITRAPSCDDVSRTTAVGEPVSVPLTCTDPDGDPLTLSIVDGPSKGSLGTIAGDAVTYTPDAGEFGTDSFTYRATDGTAAVGAGDRVDHDHAARRAATTCRGTTAVGEPVSVPLDVHRSRRRRADALDRRRPVEGLAGHDLRRFGDVHAGRGRVRDRLVHLRRDRRHRRLRARRRCRSRSRARRAATTCRGRRGRRAGLGAADLHRPRRRRADALDRRRPVEGLARRDRGRRGHLHAGRRRVRRRLLHLPRERRHGPRRRPATVSITITRAPSCDDVVAHAPRSAPRSRCRSTCTDPDGDSADALDRRRPVEGLAGRDRGRRR